jgi:hypothetical protein
MFAPEREAYGAATRLTGAEQRVPIPPIDAAILAGARDVRRALDHGSFSARSTSPARTRLHSATRVDPMAALRNE